LCPESPPTAGAGVKTNLLFFSKGRKTEKIWYYDMSHVKVGKKTPLRLAHFGFDENGEVLADALLPANLTADWLDYEANAGQPFPSYARMLKQRGNPNVDSHYSWTVDFAARRTKAREEMQPLLDESARIKAGVVDLKEKLRRLKKDKASDAELEALDAQIREHDKAARELETKTVDIDAAVFDLKAVNPNVVTKTDDRTPAQIIGSIEAQGRIVSDALAKLSALLAARE
jgi:type I restriction enzyme M protein